MSSYKTYAVAELDFNVEEIIQKSEQQMFKVANQKRTDGSSFRNSNVTWIDESDKDGALPWPELTDHIAKQIHSINIFLRYTYIYSKVCKKIKNTCTSIITK